MIEILNDSGIMAHYYPRSGNFDIKMLTLCPCKDFIERVFGRFLYPNKIPNGIKLCVAFLGCCAASSNRFSTVPRINNPMGLDLGYGLDMGCMNSY